ncbi:MAG: DNA methyltransferase [Candidatus Falkowbacteria bacterium]
MKYFFVLGSNPALSVAELASVFGLAEKRETAAGAGVCCGGKVFLLETDAKIDAAALIKNLGGTVKIGVIHEESGISTRELLSVITPRLEPGEGKFNFGLSFYGSRKMYLKPLGMEIKKYLRERGIVCRWVVSRETTLSSVVVEQNKLTAGGAEIVLLQNGDKILVGFTLAVQPFKELSFRDYGRPARDDRSGMLPPKLAQIMINLARAPKDGVILDPFCGSGTILTEAALLGYKNMIGADISVKAVEDTKKNMDWIKEKFKIPEYGLRVFHKNAAELSQAIESGSVNAIITEPYLGPQRGPVDIEITKKELTELYARALSEFKKILAPNGRIVMIWPVFHATRNSQFITPDMKGFKILNPIPESSRANAAVEPTARDTIIYGRPGQKVWREIVILEAV